MKEIDDILYKIKMLRNHVNIFRLSDEEITERLDKISNDLKHVNEMLI
jgi:hypothetical protein